MKSDLGRRRRVRFIEERPDSRLLSAHSERPDSGLDSLPTRQLATAQLLVKSELLQDVLVRRTISVQVQTVQGRLALCVSL